MAVGLGLRISRLFCLALLAAFLAPTLPSCVHHPQHRSAAVPAKKPGPPPWAPAHGYRHKHSQGVDLIFDSAIGVYLVVGYERHYFYGDRFYRHGSSGWTASASIRGPWVTVGVSALPAGLAAHPGGKHDGHRGKPPAKHGKGRDSNW